MEETEHRSDGPICRGRLQVIGHSRARHSMLGGAPVASADFDARVSGSLD
jgi:hypothetical protein